MRPDPRPVPFPNPYRISPDPSDWLAWIHSAGGRGLGLWFAGLSDFFFGHWQCRGAGGLMVLLASLLQSPITRALAPDVTSVGACVLPHGQWAWGPGPWRWVGLGPLCWVLPRPGLGAASSCRPRLPGFPPPLPNLPWQMGDKDSEVGGGGGGGGTACAVGATLPVCSPKSQAAFGLPRSPRPLRGSNAVRLPRSTQHTSNVSL